MSLGWKNHYRQNDDSTQGNLWIQYNPYQITTDGIFHRIRAKSCAVCMKIQKSLIRQDNLEKEKWSWRNQAP